MKQKENEIELTIITVCYNSEKTIEKTIESVISQWMEGVEYVLIDGGSKDRTLELIQNGQKKAPLQWISEPDQGIYDAMNKGMRLAAGRWLLYVNSDDTLKEGVLEKMLPVLRQSQVDCICTDVEMVRNVDGELYSRVWVAEEVDERVYLYLTCSHQGMYLRKQTLMELGGFDCQFPIAADWDMLCQMYEKKKRFEIFHILNVAFLEGGASNKYLVRENHCVRKKHHGYGIIDWRMLWDLKNYLRSKAGSLILGKKKEELVIKSKYTKVGK